MNNGSEDNSVYSGQGVTWNDKPTENYLPSYQSIVESFSQNKLVKIVDSAKKQEQWIHD